MLLATRSRLPLSSVASGLGLGLGLMALNPWRGQAAEGLHCRVARLELPLPRARRVLQLLANCYTLAGRLARERLTRIVDKPPRAGMASSVGMMDAIIVLPVRLGSLLPSTLALVLLGAWHWGTVGLAALWPSEAPN